MPVGPDGIERVRAMPYFALDVPEWGPCRLKFALPCWFLVIVCALIEIVVIRAGSRFSMQTLLAATTVAALLFGAIAWSVRSGS